MMSGSCGTSRVCRLDSSVLLSVGFAAGSQNVQRETTAAELRVTAKRHCPTVICCEEKASVSWTLCWLFRGSAMSSKTWLRACATAVLSLALSASVAVAQGNGHGHDKHDRDDDDDHGHGHRRNKEHGHGRYKDHDGDIRG